MSDGHLKLYLLPVSSCSCFAKWQSKVRLPCANVYFRHCHQKSNGSPPSLPFSPGPLQLLDFRTHGLNECMLGVCKMAWMTGEIGSLNERSEPRHQLVQQEPAAPLRSLLSRHNIQHCVFLTSPRQNGNAVGASGQRNVPLPASRAVSLCSLVPPRPVGSGVEKGLHTLLCLLCLRWRISSLSCQCSDCMWRRGRGCVASSEKISCLYFIFCSCSTFFFFFSPLIIPPSPCEWYVWTISFKTSFLSRLDGQQRQLCNQAKMCTQAFISCSGQSSKCLPPAFFFFFPFSPFAVIL